MKPKVVVKLVVKLKPNVVVKLKTKVVTIFHELDLIHLENSAAILQKFLLVLHFILHFVLHV